MNIFDIVIPLGILLAMLFSSMPKKAAMAVCLYASLAMIIIDLKAPESGLSLWFYYYSSCFIEFTAFVGFLYFARYQRLREDRMFFRAMSGFFLLSTAVTWIFIYDYILAYSTYALISHFVAVIHMGFMMAYSDGIRILIGNWRDTLVGNRGRAVNP